MFFDLIIEKFLCFLFCPFLPKKLEKFIFWKCKKAFIRQILTYRPFLTNELCWEVGFIRQILTYRFIRQILTYKLHFPLCFIGLQSPIRQILTYRHVFSNELYGNLESIRQILTYKNFMLFTFLHFFIFWKKLDFSIRQILTYKKTNKNQGKVDFWVSKKNFYTSNFDL